MAKAGSKQMPEMPVRGGQGHDQKDLVRRATDMAGGLVVMGLLAAAAALLGGCTQTRYVAVPVPQSAPATPVLQACADHAAAAQRQAFGERFRGLQFDSGQLVLASPANKVGSQEVGAVYDGNGQWYGRQPGTMGEWRAIRFHCMVSPVGNVVYSFVRAE
ncbi:MAG: hypothetical protein EON60_11255 [Alphaproteobacteria bacterium]|nr:MAG: hypothetical protein EON60_11255 [Alphaproteobacteria bacterium]